MAMRTTLEKNKTQKITMIGKTRNFLVKTKIARMIATRNFSLPKVAIGERNTYSSFPLDWIKVDWESADFNINLALNPILPFENSSKQLIYTAHVIEHLPEESLLQLLRECHRILEPGGWIRIEAPDAEKLVELYLENDEFMLNHFRQFRKNVLVEKYGYSSIFLDDHLSVLGEVSSYIVKGQPCHVPVYASKEVFDEKLATLKLDDFGSSGLTMRG